jgi:signal transduction histidine kinase
MRRFATELLSTRGIRLSFESSGDARLRLNADVRRNAFLIFKETINNVVRHASATAVTVEVTLEPRRVHMVVCDDGCGFDTTTLASGHGLRSLDRRASSLGGSLAVVSSAGAGTRVSITLPVT